MLAAATAAVVVVVCGGGSSGGGESWWNAGVGINGVLWKRADLAATGVTCRDDQCRCGDSAREKFKMIFSHRRTRWRRDEYGNERKG